MTFELTQALANGRLPQAEIAAGSRQTAAFDDAHKDAHGEKKVHGRQFIKLFDDGYRSRACSRWPFSR
jgi:hypothetical protein